MTQPDLAAMLTAAIAQHRVQINESRVACGAPGRVEININLAVGHIDLQVLIAERAPWRTLASPASTLGG